MGHSLELLGNHICMHVGLGTSEHTLPSRKQEVYEDLAHIPYASLPYCTGNYAAVGF